MPESGWEILLFEANATMVVEQPDKDPCWDYRSAAVERIHAAAQSSVDRSGGRNRGSVVTSTFVSARRPIMPVIADIRR
jgi:hypothetical protein